MTISQESDVKSKIKRWSVFLISPVVWTAYFMVVYTFNEIVCGLNIFRSVVWGRFTTADIIMLLLTVVPLLATGVGFYFGRQIWLDSKQHEQGISTERDYFIGRSAMLLSGLFAILTLGMTAVILVLNSC
jgi:hypothetical protein